MKDPVGVVQDVFGAKRRVQISLTFRQGNHRRAFGQGGEKCGSKVGASTVARFVGVERKDVAIVGARQEFPHRHAASRRNLRADLGGGQHAAMARLGALAELDLDHLDLVMCGGLGEFLAAESPVRVAGAEIIEVGFNYATFPYELDQAINEKTAAVFFLAGLGKKALPLASVLWQLTSSS